MSVSAIALAGITSAVKQFDEAAEGVRRATSSDPETTDRADLSEAAVKLLTARTAYKAAIEVAKSADEINEHAIDLLA